MPILDIHDIDPAGEPLFELPRSTTRLASGSVVMADQYAQRLRFFDARGRQLRIVGREGRGPGEFVDIRWVSQCRADTLFVWDYARRTVLVFDTAGNFAREYRPAGNPHEMRCNRQGLFGVLGLPTEMRPLDPDGPPLEAPIWMADVVGDSTHWIGLTRFGQNRVLGAWTRIAVGRDRFWVGTAEAGSVDAYGADGTRHDSILVAIDPRPPTRRNFVRAIDAGLSVARSKMVRDMQRPAMEAMPMPDRMPPYSELLVDTEDLLWIVTSAPGDERTAIRVVDAAGAETALVELPAEVTIHEVGRDYVLGISQDTTGLQHLVVYALNRR